MHVNKFRNSNCSIFQDDVAVLKLERRLHFNAHVQPICLGRSNLFNSLWRDASVMRTAKLLLKTNGHVQTKHLTLQVNKETSRKTKE